MKNKSVFLAVFTILLAVVLGCGGLNPFGGGSKPAKSGDPASSKPVDPAAGEPDAPVVVEKTGVKECDELMDLIARQAQSKDDNYITKSAREFFLNRIRESLRKSIEEQKGKPEELAKKCTEFKTQLETYKAREDEKKESQ